MNIGIVDGLLGPITDTVSSIVTTIESVAGKDMVGAAANAGTVLINGAAILTDSGYLSTLNSAVGTTSKAAMTIKRFPDQMEALNTSLSN